MTFLLHRLRHVPILVLVLAALSAVFLAAGIYSFAQVKPTVCRRLDALVTVDQDRIRRGRKPTLAQDYYLEHPAKAAAFTRRSKRSVAELEGARC